MTTFRRLPRLGHVMLLPAMLALGSCRRSDPPVFELLSADRTGIAFANTITTSDTLNIQTDVYLYNGAGVAAGDIDNDGLPDLFFAGNMVTSRLYLNKGDMRFEDITDRAGVKTSKWATGVTMVDINNDGFLDIYVSVSGPEWSKPEERGNLLFINNGNKTFTESAAKYGLGDTGFSTHAAFLDYDRDGCVDMFLLNNAPGDFARGEVASIPSGIKPETPDSHNQLYRNDCHGSFTNVSTQAGILQKAGYGLGVAVSDLNGDGWPDIYVSNDVITNDVLYVNNGNGTFTDKRDRWLKHTSYAGMGVDVADFNNDGWPDILQSDMMPRTLERRKRTSGFNTYSGMLDTRKRGFLDDYSENSLQLSNGVTPNGDLVFSEIGRLAGVSHTDWSWAALFADFDNDGLKDIFIGNGYPKAVNDLDYMTTTRASREPGRANAVRKAGLEHLRQLPGYDETNFVFRNGGDLTFADRTKAWGMERPSYSYGAAYADLDNDGRLDLVVNNIDAPAFIYRNVQPAGESHHFLRVALQGVASNRQGIGATLVLSAGGQKQYVYQSPARGFMSTVDDRPHFGLGSAKRVDTLSVIWADGSTQTLTGLGVDTVVTLKQADATAKHAGPLLALPSERPFQAVEAGQALAYQHQAETGIDYGAQQLLPYMLSRQGPPIAVADVNRDGLDDVFLGGAAGVAGQLFIQEKDGRFVSSAAGQPWEADRAYGDWGALFFDANGDGLPDLYVASGGYDLGPTSPRLQDRLYVNRGGGRFVRDSLALPTMHTSTAAVRAGDYDGDGRLDLFVGGRLVPQKYPFPTRSYVLHNEGRGQFKDVTESVAPALAKPVGMITDAAWVDLDGDKRQDLVTVGEWMTPQFYHNDGRQLVDVTAQTKLPPMRGWWSSIAVGDFDGDGRPDLIAGNLGLNYTYTTSKDSAFGVYAGDFTGNQNTDVVLTQTVNGIEYPLAGMIPLGRELYTLAIKFPTYGSFADATLAQLFSKQQLAQALHYQADTFASVFLHNDGGGAFTSTPLPSLAQISPIKAIVPFDVDSDGHLDAIVGGNLYDAEPNVARADAGNGLWLRGDGRGHFAAVSPRESGFLAPLNVSSLALVGRAGGKALLVGNTGDSLQTYNVGRTSAPATAKR
jgi:hypothetical protein